MTRACMKHNGALCRQEKTALEQRTRAQEQRKHDRVHAARRARTLSLGRAMAAGALAPCRHEGLEDAANVLREELRLAHVVGDGARALLRQLV
eukprot:6162084-Lingulodinium_polyedra.AAC.1